MDASDLARWRMAAQGLWSPDATTPEAVMQALTASQAQDLLPGRWSLAQRCREPATDTSVSEALDAGRILRTHVLRPTWHVVTPEALKWLLAATAPRVHQAKSSMDRKVGVDAELMRAVRPVLERLLGHHHATRAEIAEALGAVGIHADGVRLAHLVMYAELEGWICSGRQQGTTQTYALVEERVPDARPVDLEEALNWLADAYVTSRGPATVKDLAAWASLTLTEARRAIASIIDRVETLEIDGRVYYVPRDASPTPPRGEPIVNLLQTYDELLSSYADSREAVAGARVLEQERTQFMHPVLLDGRLLGRWRYERDKAGRPFRIETRLLRELTGAEREALGVEVGRFAAFVGREVDSR